MSKKGLVGNTDKIKKIELYTKRLLNNMRMGIGKSKQRSVGFDFEQLREYQPGDDVRHIAWRASCRSNKLMTKEFIQEQSFNVVLVADVSSSMFLLDGTQTKFDRIAWVASVIALAAGYGNDAVELVLFDEYVVKHIPLRTGLSHARHIVQVLLDVKRPKNIVKTDIAFVSRWLLQCCKRSSLIFVMSDFINEINNYQELRLIERFFDVIALRCNNIVEREVNVRGLLTMRDAETGVYGDFLFSGNHGMINKLLQQRYNDQTHWFKKTGIDCLAIDQERDVIHALVKLFKHRTR
jgi:uncharacterized protein (DUF58 family)